MSAEKSPAFQFYPKDFLTDSHVVAMTLAERGAYITLLCLCWLDRSLPVEMGALARLCGVSSAAFTRLWPAFFKHAHDKVCGCCALTISILPEM